MMRTAKSFLILILFSVAAFAVGCGGNGTGGGAGTAAVPTATPASPGGTDTVVIGQPGLCTPGDVARVEVDSGGRARFPLVSADVTCTPAKDNRIEEYTLIMYNTSAAAQSFQLFAPINVTPPPNTPTPVGATTALTRATDLDDQPLAPPISTAHYTTGQTSMNRQAEAMARFRKTNQSSYLQHRLGGSRLASLAVGDQAEFKVRSDPTNPNVFTTTSGILRATGTHINIFLDRDLSFCAGSCPGGATADTFTGDQLDHVIQIFEQNIYPLATQVLGAPSDVDSDGKIAILVTPILNRDILSASYTDSRNLLPFDPVSNPGSNEAEVIFVYAPDSLGNFKNAGQDDSQFWFNVPAADYVTKSLNAWIMFNLTKIISFNQHVLVSGGNAEDDWIDDGVGAVMADLAGFNIWRTGAWMFLTQPQLHDLRGATEFDTPESTNPAYLFMLYYLQSQVDTTLTETNGIDSDLQVFHKLMTSGLTSIANLEAAVNFTFDSTKETKFEAIFKDWTIATATSGSHRTDLQQVTDALKYYFNLNPTVYGSEVGDVNGSVRYGAIGNDIGIDLNGYHPEEGVLIENADEHVAAPGNAMFGYVDPYAAMYVRLGGLFQQTQTVALKTSSSNLKGFIIRRSDISYPHVYSESIFGSIDQHAEDLDAVGPDTYWPKKLDLVSLVSTPAPANRPAQDFLTIVGRIDPSSQIRVCPANTDDCALTSVPDTDKYIFTVPPGAGSGDLAFVLRRQFDSGADTAALKPMLAVVSSKDVPYPYVPHPIRAAVVASTNTRQPYRWLTSQLICGDDQGTASTGVITNTAVDCTPKADLDSPKILFDTTAGLVENTGAFTLNSGPNWNGDIVGGDCANPPSEPLALGAFTTGYGTGHLYGVTNKETSPSPLGTYPWLHSFMEASYNGGGYPDILFAREFLTNTSGYPALASPPALNYDPRSINSLTLNCHLLRTIPDLIPDADQIADSPDNFLAANELSQPTTLVQQILTEMSRGRVTSTGTAESAILATQYVDKDIFAIDVDSRDGDECDLADLGNNLNELTVRSGAGSMLWGNFSSLEPHIARNLNASALGQTIYDRPAADPVLGYVLTLTPGKSYTVIVAGTGGTVGNYELRIRKINHDSIREAIVRPVTASGKCISLAE